MKHSKPKLKSLLILLFSFFLSFQPLAVFAQESPQPTETPQQTETPVTQETIVSNSAENTSVVEGEVEEDDEVGVLELGDNKAEVDAVKDMTAVVRQSTDYLCGPAALATLLTQRGDDTTENQVVENIPADEISKEKGTNLLSLKNSAQKLNQQIALKKWSAEIVLQYVTDTGDPVLIHDEKKGVGGHFSVIKSYDAEKGLVELSDTEAGNIKYSVEDFKKLYTGNALVIYEGETFGILSDVSTDISDSDASNIWGMYVPVYLLAERSGDKEAIQLGKDYEVCIAKAMNIQEKTARNNARATCYTNLSQNLNGKRADGKEYNLSSVQEANLANAYNLNYYNPFDKQNESAVGTVDIISALSNIKTFQLKYLDTLSSLNNKIQQLGGMSVAQAQSFASQIASLTAQISQLNYEKSQLENAIKPKNSTINSLQNEINQGSFTQNGQTFQLGNVGNQVSVAKSQYANLSNSLNQKLSSIDGQINQARSQLSNAQNNKRNAENKANSYQGQINNANSTANNYERSANNSYSSYQRAKWHQKAGHYSSYLWNKAQANYYRGQAGYYQGLVNIQRSFANNYQNDINNQNNKIAQLERDKTNARNSLTSQLNQASAESARLQRLQDFGNAELNRKKGLLAQLKNEVSKLQPQLDQRVSKISSLNSQLSSAKSKESASREVLAINTELTNIEKQINTIKSKWGFSSITNINTQETDKLKQEELAFEKSQDNLAYKTATDRSNTVLQISDGINTIVSKAVEVAIQQFLKEHHITPEMIGSGVAVIVDGQAYLFNQLPPNVQKQITDTIGEEKEKIYVAYDKLSPETKDQISSTLSIGEAVLTVVPATKVLKAGKVTKEVAVAGNVAKSIGIESKGIGYLDDATMDALKIAKSATKEIPLSLKSAGGIVDEVIKTPGVDIWEFKPLTRGQLGDIAFGNNVGRTAKTIDFFEEATGFEKATAVLENGTVKSFKTLDHGATTYKDSGKMLSRLKSDINKLDGYTDGDIYINGETQRIIFGKDFSKKVFSLGIRDIGLYPGQLEAINEAKAYANGLGIDFVVTVLTK